MADVIEEVIKTVTGENSSFPSEMFVGAGTPDEALIDSIRIQTFADLSKTLVDTAIPENAGGAVAAHLEMEAQIQAIREKYADPEAKKKINGFLQNAGVDLDSLQTGDIEGKLADFDKQAKNDPYISEMMNISKAQNKERIEGLQRQIRESEERTAQKQEQYGADARVITLHDADSAVDKMEADGDLAKLKELHANVEKLIKQEKWPPLDEQLKAYDDFFKAYSKALGLAYADDKEAIKGRDMPDALREAIKNEVDTQAEIPKELFSDKATHYMGLVAEEGKALMDEAENIKIEGSTQEQIELLKKQMKLIFKAESYLGSTADEPVSAENSCSNTPKSMDADNTEEEPTIKDIIPRDDEYIQNLAGYSSAYLLERQEEIHLHIELLDGTYSSYADKMRTLCKSEYDLEYENDEDDLDEDRESEINATSGQGGMDLPPPPAEGEPAPHADSVELETDKPAWKRPPEELEKDVVPSSPLGESVFLSAAPPSRSSSNTMKV